MYLQCTVAGVILGVMAQVSDLITALESIAPPHLAEDWDTVGLQVGDPDWPVQRALMCIDLTEAVLEEAIRQQAQFILAYHPLCFKPFKRLTTADLKQRIALRAASHQVAVYAPHTALDAAEDGVNDWLTAGLGDGIVVPIRPIAAQTGAMKLVTFIPADSVDSLRDSLAYFGAGQIGAYSHCSFMLKGEGTFFGDDSADPAVGERGLLEKVPETRVEMVIPAEHTGRLDLLLEVLRHVHPYEEPAFDVYPLTRTAGDGLDRDPTVGPGRLLQFEQPISLNELANRLATRLGCDGLEIAKPVGGAAKIQRVGVCVGAGGSLLSEAGSVDAFITGEMRHHDILDATSRGIAILLAGHTQTERPYLKPLRQRLANLNGLDVTWQISRSDRAPTTRFTPDKTSRSMF